VWWCGSQSDGRRNRVAVLFGQGLCLEGEVSPRWQGKSNKSKRSKKSKVVEVCGKCVGVECMAMRGNEEGEGRE